MAFGRRLFDLVPDNAATQCMLVVDCSGVFVHLSMDGDGKFREILQGHNGTLRCVSSFCYALESNQ